MIDSHKKKDTNRFVSIFPIDRCVFRNDPIAFHFFIRHQREAYGSAEFIPVPISAAPCISCSQLCRVHWKCIGTSKMKSWALPWLKRNLYNLTSFESSCSRQHHTSVSVKKDLSEKHSNRIFFQSLYFIKSNHFSLKQSRCSFMLKCTMLELNCCSTFYDIFPRRFRYWRPEKK